MKKNLVLLLFVASLHLLPATADAQCSVCKRSTEQMGDKPAGKINSGIFYLAATPLLILGFIGYRWWKRDGHEG